MDSTSICTIPECGKPHYALGLCQKHYTRQRNYGSTDGKAPKRPKPVCAVSGCERTVGYFGYCKMHWRRLQSRGDAGEVGKELGKPLEFLRSILGTTNEECILWPFSMAHGYGHLGIDSKVVKAHRLILEWTVPRPDPKLNALHRCDTKRCVNPNHLYWGTQIDNVRDFKLSGRVKRKLTFQQAREIVVLLREGKLSQPQIAKLFGINQTMVSAIKRKKSWPEAWD